MSSFKCFDYYCKKCNKQEEKIVEHVDSEVRCDACGKKMKKLPASYGGYQMNSGGSSTRPRYSGSFKRKKK